MSLVVELLIIFIGVPLLVYKLCSQNSRVQKASFHTMISVKTQSSLWNKKAEFEITSIWKSGNIGDIWKLISEIPREDMVFIFGDDWKILLLDFFEKYPHYIYRNDLSSIYNILEALIMSQRGYEMMFQEYILVGGITGIPTEYHVCINRAPDYNYIENVWPGVRKRTCKIVERNMQKKHPGFEMYVSPYDNTLQTGHKHGYRAVWNFKLNNCDKGLTMVKPWDV